MANPDITIISNEEGKRILDAERRWERMWPIYVLRWIIYVNFLCFAATVASGIIAATPILFVFGAVNLFHVILWSSILYLFDETLF